MSRTASPSGRTFYKMTGSGNDFVFFDVRDEPAGELETVSIVQRLSAHGTGVGADGVVFLDRSKVADVAIRYYNADGSLAALCGNATLCTTSLATRLEAVSESGFTIETGSGIVSARLRNGVPEIDLLPVTDAEPEYTHIELAPGERRIGYATAGVPHLVILVGDLEAVDIVARGRPLRHHRSLEHGANVNFVARDSAGQWSIRTYERGVEDETLACGTGNVAAAVLLKAWGEVSDDVELLTRSGLVLGVRLTPNGGGWQPSLRGEGRLVYTGVLGTI